MNEAAGRLAWEDFAAGEDAFLDELAKPRWGRDRRYAVAAWKRFLAWQCGIVWQKGFFDHRLRNEAERAEKWAYVEGNPIAKGLCDAAEDWPFRRTW